MGAAGEVGSLTLAHLPIVKEYARRMGLVELVDRALVSGMQLSPGKALLGLVMNVLCGRGRRFTGWRSIFGCVTCRCFWERR